MSIQFPTPSELGDDYLTNLKTLKPEVDTSRTDSDWYIRSRVVGGMISGLYADQRLIADDAFPQSARREALEKHLILYFGSGFIQATQAQGDVAVTGTVGTVIPIGTEFTYEPNGNTYQSTEQVTIGSQGVALVPVLSVNEGQEQNLLTGAPLVVSSPPSGLNEDAEASGAIANGRNDESNEEAAQRILNRIQAPPAGGTANDYATWALEADDSVTDANVIRWIYGLGTVGIVITAGTTDIDEALNNGDPVVREPSDALVDTVQAYIDSKKPLTDCAHVVKPGVVELDVTVRVRFASGDSNTVPAGTTLTQAELVQREVKRALYKTPPGGRHFGTDTTGYVVKSEIEEIIDSGLSALPYTVGEYFQILSDRQVDDLTASGANRMILDREVVIPGTITVVEL